MKTFYGESMKNLAEDVYFRNNQEEHDGNL